MDVITLAIIGFVAIAGPPSSHSCSTGETTQTSGRPGAAHRSTRPTPTPSTSQVRIGGSRGGPLVGPGAAATTTAPAAEVGRAEVGGDPARVGAAADRYARGNTCRNLGISANLRVGFLDRANARRGRSAAQAAVFHNYAFLGREGGHRRSLISIRIYYVAEQARLAR